MFTLLYEILIKIFGDVLSNSFKDIIENKIFHVGKKIRCSEIIEEPNLIMGDRGLESDGFLKNLYYHRDVVDDELSKQVKEGIVVIEGRPASGKSRVVWEFIRNSAGAYKSVYIPKGSVSDAEYSKKLKGEVGRLSKSTLIVIDEIESLWEKKHLDETSLSLLLQTINERELPCIVTISNFNEHYKVICDTIRKEVSLGSRKDRVIKFVTIRDIERDDDTFCWCKANMPVRKYAKVIGGYIPRLSRYYNATIKNIIETNKAAVAYLATFNILIRFRNRTRVLQERMKELYLAIKENDKSWKLPKWEEILREDTGTADILFKSGILKNQDGSIEIDDNFLYESFIDSCIIKVKGKDDISMIVTKYLSDTCASEKEQICRLIDMEKGKDPSIISRIVARSRYEDNRKYAIDCFKKRFFEYKNNQLKVRPDCDAASPELSFACSLIASRDPDPIACSTEFLEAGIKPNIIFVSEIIRAACRKSSDDGKELVKYAQSLKDKYSLEPNLYYWQVVETFEAGYDENRIKEGIRLYSKIYEDSSMDEEEVDNQKATFEGFCRALIMKADSSERMDQYFELLKNNSALVFSKSSLKKLIYRISDRYGVNSSPILEKLSNKLLGIINDSDKTEVCNTGLIYIIGQCMNVSAALNIYESIKKYAESIKDEDERNSFLNIITISLTRKMREIKRDSDEYKKIRDEIKVRIDSSKSEDYNGNSNTGAVLKLFNAFLNNQPLYPSGDSLVKMLELYNDTSLFSGKKDIDTLNSAFHNVLDANEKYDSKSDVIDYCERLKTIGRKFNELRKKSKLTADGRFKLFMFKVIEKIKFADKDGKVNTEDIRSLIDFRDDISEATAPNLCSDELLWCQVVKLSNDIGLLNKIAGQCIQMIDESGIYLTNLTNHLFSVFYQKFPNEKKFQGELEELEKRTYNLISNTVFDYQHYLGFDACTGSIKTKDDVVSFINEAWTRLQHINKPLRENKGDLLYIAINLKFISFEDAVDIIDLAIEYDRKQKYRSSTILTVDVIVELAKKFQNEAAMRTREEDKIILQEYAKKIQLLVNKLSYIDYPSEEFFLNNINRYCRTIQMPLASNDEFIRRAAFENRIDENGSLRCREYEAKCFLDRELYFSNKAIINDIDRNYSQISNIDDNIKYIIWVIEKTLDARLQLDVKALNDERFCKVFSKRNGHMKDYDNFFQGYLAEGYVPESSVDEWAQIAQKCGFAVECSNL